MKRNLIKLSLLCILISASSCGKNTPVKIGFIGSMTGNDALSGENGRNGVLLAVENINARGGINGRKVVLLIRDDRNDVVKARKSAHELITEEVEGIIGPLTSTMTKAVISETNPAKTVVITPTASSPEFKGKDDYLFLLSPPLGQKTEEYAEFLFNIRKYHTASILTDTQNSAYTGAWSKSFVIDYKKKGGTVLNQSSFDSTEFKGYRELVTDLLDPYPHVIVIVSNSLGVVRFAQQLRKTDTKIPIIACEWAGAQKQMIELGGTSINGMEVLLAYNRAEYNPRLYSLNNSYSDLFNTNPGDTAIVSYEAAMVLIQALQLKSDDESVKESLLRNSPYEGIEAPLEIDRFGDTKRKHVFVMIKDGSVIPSQ